MNSKFYVDFDGISLEATVTNKASMAKSWIDDIKAANSGKEIDDIKPIINRTTNSGKEIDYIKAANSGKEIDDIKPIINRATNSGKEIDYIKAANSGKEIDDIKPIIKRATNSGKEIDVIKPIINRATNSRKELLVGFHSEWYMELEEYADSILSAASEDPEPQYLGRLSVLQFCVGSKCLLFHILRSDVAREALKDFLCDPEITFVGVGVAEELFRTKLYLGCDCGRSMELGPLAARKLGRKQLLRVGLEELATEILDLDIKKPEGLGHIYQSTVDFTYRQIKYGCVDCYAPFAIASKLLEKD